MFDPVRSYDKPGVILAQLANGIATTDSVRRVLFDPAALSPRERESFADKLKAEMGGNAVADTAIDVLANPLVWLGVVAGALSSPGQASLAAGGRFFGGVGEYAKAKFPFLRSLRLTSGIHENPKLALMAQVSSERMLRARQGLSEHMQDEVSRVLQLLSKKHGVEVTRLEPESAPNQAVAEDLRLIRGANHIRGLGLEQDRVESVIGGVGPSRFHVRFERPSSFDPTKAVVDEVEVSDHLHRKLREIFVGKGVRVNQTLSVAEHENLLRALPGLDKADSNLLESMKRLELKEITFRPGLNPKSLGGAMSEQDASMDMASVVEGGPRVHWDEIERQKLVTDTAALEAVEAEFGLKSFQDAENRLYTHGRVLLAGDEAHYASTGEFRLDREKVLRMARSKLMNLKQAGYLTENGHIEAGAEEAVVALLEDETAGRLMEAAKDRLRGGIRRGATRQEIEDTVVEAYTKAYQDPFYRPRNTTEAYDRSGRRVPYNPYEAGVEGIGANYEPGTSGRTAMRTRKAAMSWHPEDLRFLRDKFGGTVVLDRMITHAENSQAQQLSEGNTYKFYRIAPDVAAAKYQSSVARDYALFAHDVSLDPGMRAIIQDYGFGSHKDKEGKPFITRVRLPGPTGASKEGAPIGSRDLSGVPADMRPAGGYTMFDLMNAELQAQAELEAHHGHGHYATDLWRRHILPATFGIKPLEDAAHVAAASKIRGAVGALADSKFMRAVEAENKHAARFVQGMRTWANDPMGDNVLPWQNVTKTLYMSHLGLNFGSALINLLQPLQSVHQLGFRNTVRAYGQTLEQLGEYARARSALGPNAKPDEIRAAFNKAFSRNFAGRSMDLADVAEIGNSWEMLEKAGYGAHTEVGRPQHRIFEMMMKPFQFSETVNRSVTANAMLNAYEASGRGAGLDFERARQEAFLGVQMLQFGSTPMNRPGLFYKDFLKEAPFRQFAQYGLRTFANLFTIPGMVGGDRSIAGMRVKSPTGVAWTDMMRGMAVSAVAYEIAKSSLGVDLSRGLMLGGPADLIGGDRALQQKNFPMYIPPILDIGWDAARYLASGDVEILQDWAPRVIPGGVAISRALGSAPQAGVPAVLGLQKTYADWSQSQSGYVPMYNSDGRFMGQYPTSDVVLKALGMDMGRFSQPQEVSQFLLKNRDEIREARRQFIAAVLGNNMGAANQVKEGFERKFGLPLTVTQAQFKEAQRLREQSIVQRTMGSIDQGVRGQYQQAVQQYVPGQLMAPGQAPDVNEQGDMYRWGQG